MSSLKSHEKVIFEQLVDRGGYVLNFSDRTYSKFFREHGINIDNDKYKIHGQSKMKRLRAFLEIENDLVVGKILDALLEYALAISQIASDEVTKAKEIIGRLCGIQSTVQQALNVNDFLAREFQP